MATRSGSSSSRASGGVNAAGNPLDTLVVIGGDGRKKILSVAWSTGSNGAGIAAASLPLYSRLVIVTADLSALVAFGVNFPTGVNADLGPNGIVNAGGRIVFDIDVQAASGMINGQFSFPDAGNEGWVGTDSGAISILLTAPQLSTGAAPVGIVGKLTVQYDNTYSNSPSDGPPGYNYTPNSGAARR